MQRCKAIAPSLEKCTCILLLFYFTLEPTGLLCEKFNETCTTGDCVNVDHCALKGFEGRHVCLSTFFYRNDSFEIRVSKHVHMVAFCITRIVM